MDLEPQIVAINIGHDGAPVKKVERGAGGKLVAPLNLSQHGEIILRCLPKGLRRCDPGCIYIPGRD